jgi:maleate isomerase
MDMIGWRARIGVIQPGDAVLDHEFFECVPRNVSVHLTRTEYPLDLPPLERALSLATSSDIEQAAKTFKAIKPAVVAYACTAASICRGIGGDADISSRISDIVGVPATTTGTAVVAGLRALGVARVAVLTPYIEAVTRALVDFLSASGLTVVRHQAVGLRLGFADVPPWDVYRHAREAFVPEAEALFISCTNFRSLEVVAALEGDRGRPALSANQCTMWHALRLAGIHEPVPNLGRLFTVAVRTADLPAGIAST